MQEIIEKKTREREAANGQEEGSDSGENLDQLANLCREYKQQTPQLSVRNKRVSILSYVREPAV